jgi:hypothetical protein
MGIEHFSPVKQIPGTSFGYRRCWQLKDSPRRTILANDGAAGVALTGPQQIGGGCVDASRAVVDRVLASALRDNCPFDRFLRWPQDARGIAGKRIIAHTDRNSVSEVRVLPMPTLPWLSTAKERWRWSQSEVFTNPHLVLQNAGT